jgi:quinol monooxygenase YgiN
LQARAKPFHNEVCHDDAWHDDDGKREREDSMIVVTGSVTARQDSFDEVRRLSLEHVRRSRGEPGCISHAVHVDCENPLRLVFIEQWADRAALQAHFAVPASRDFVRALQPLAAEATSIELYDATRLENL